MCSEKVPRDLIKGVRGSGTLPAGCDAMYPEGSCLALAPEQTHPGQLKRYVNMLLMTLPARGFIRFPSIKEI